MVFVDIPQLFSIVAGSYHSEYTERTADESIPSGISVLRNQLTISPILLFIGAPIFHRNAIMIIAILVADSTCLILLIIKLPQCLHLVEHGVGNFQIRLKERIVRCGCRADGMGFQIVKIIIGVILCITKHRLPIGFLFNNASEGIVFHIANHRSI